jgi:prolipoprotein diacylglyceryltransferase
MYYKKDMGRRKAGVMFGVGLIGIFVTRFFIEFFKVNQEAFEEGMLLNMGQTLSIPFMILAVWMLWQAAHGKFRVGVPDKYSKPQVANKKK